MPPNLPGFYYDEERGRYFRISTIAERASDPSYNVQAIKKRKLKQKNETQSQTLAEERYKLLQKYVFQLADPFQRAFGGPSTTEFISGLRIEDYIHMDTNAYQTTINRSFGTSEQHHIMSSAIICDECSSESVSFIYSTSNGSLQRYSQGGVMLDNTIRDGPTDSKLFEIESPLSTTNQASEFFNYKTINLRQNEQPFGGLYFHAQRAHSNTHVFVHVNHEISSKKVRVLNLKLWENVYDSADLGEHFVVAVNSELRIYSWKEHSGDRSIYSQQLDGKRNSDILCIALNRSTQAPIKLYAGCRDGSIYSITLKAGFKPDFSSLSRYKVPSVRSIISIKTTDIQGIIFVSAVSKHLQAIYMIDLMLDSRECRIATFKTTFSNLTKDQEYFEVTSDGHYFFYGSSMARDGKGDIEVFSSQLSDNVKYERSEDSHGKSVTFFPLRSLKNEILKGTDCQARKLRAVTLGTPPKDTEELKFAEDDSRSQYPHYQNNYYRLVMVFDDCSTQLSNIFLPSMALVSTNLV